MITELTGAKDERAAPVLAYFVRHLDRRKQHRLLLSSIEALGRVGGPHAVDPLKFALYQGEWAAPFETRRMRAAAASALRWVGTPAALDVLREAAQRGPRGVRQAARAALSGVE